MGRNKSQLYTKLNIRVILAKAYLRDCAHAVFINLVFNIIIIYWFSCLFAIDLT